MMIAAGLVVVLVTEASARQRPERDPDPVRTGIVQNVIDADTVRLRSGTEIRLVGIQAPKLPLGRRGFRAWPLADKAKGFVERMATGKQVILEYGGRKTDRHRRLLAHLFLENGAWVQGEILKSGFARVYSFPDNRARVAEMLSLEQEARSARRGIWDHPYYAIRNPGNADRFIGSFQIVEGKPESIALVRNRAYLNFGKNWREDFTVTMSPKVMRRFWRGKDIRAAYADRIIRVRGWLKRFNGPQIEVTHPEQIEVLK